MGFVAGGAATSPTRGRKRKRRVQKETARDDEEHELSFLALADRVRFYSRHVSLKY